MFDLQTGRFWHGVKIQHDRRKFYRLPNTDGQCNRRKLALLILHIEYLLFTVRLGDSAIHALNQAVTAIILDMQSGRKLLIVTINAYQLFSQIR